MEWKRKYDVLQIMFGNLTSLVLVFGGGYLMTQQPSGGGNAFAVGLWATILGVGMLISATIKEVGNYYD